MMREILFRGKRIDGGGWVYGSLVVDTRRNLTFIVHSPNPDMPPISTPVHPETIGQFTGLTDKNGTKIFEGDTVHVLYNRLGFINVEFKNGAFNISRYDVKNTLVTGNIHDNKTLEL